jgi:hypothetical protein
MAGLRFVVANGDADAIFFIRLGRRFRGRWGAFFGQQVLHARFLAPLEKARRFGMTPEELLRGE